MKQSKKYAASLALIEKGKAYSLTEAVALVKRQLQQSLMEQSIFPSISISIPNKLTNN